MHTCSAVEAEDARISCISSVRFAGTSDARLLFTSKLGLEIRMARKVESLSFVICEIEEVGEKEDFFLQRK